MPSPENLGDQFSEQKAPYAPHFLAMPYTDSKDNSGYSKIVNIGQRSHVLAWIRGVKVPFYKSTGLGNKVNVEDGKWYPHFGIGSDNWINKGSEEAINSHYNSKHLKGVSDWLNRNLGDYDDRQVPNAANEGPHIDAINSDMEPVTRTSETPVQRHGNKVLEKIHLEPRTPNAQERMADATAHQLLKKHAEEQPDLDLGAQLP